MSFVKAGMTFAASTGTKLVLGLIIIKIIALNVGADGLGKLGQFMSVMGMVTLLAGGGIFTGLIKYVAELRNDLSELKKYLSSGSMITLTTSSVVALLLCLFARKISMILIGSEKYYDIIYILAVVQFLIGANNFATSVISGHQDAQGFAKVTVAGSVAGAGLVYILTISGGLRGAMCGLILMPALMSLFSITYVFRRRFLTTDKIVPCFHKKVTGKLLQYSGMLCVTATTLPVAQIAVRNLIVQQYGWSAVGYWQGVNRVSDAYLQFVTVVLGNYYLPRLSATYNKSDLRLEVYRALQVAVPITMVMATVVYFLKDWIVSILFSADFYPMRDFFLFQTFGDCLKVCAHTIAYVAVAKALTRIYILSEISQSIVFVCLSFLFLKTFGPVGVTYAHFVTYLLYFIIGIIAFSFYVTSEKSHSTT